MTQPGNTDPLTQIQCLYPCTERINAANGPMPRDDRQDRMWQLTIHNVKISTAHTAGCHADPNFTRARHTVGQNRPLQIGLQPIQYHRLHASPRSSRLPIDTTALTALTQPQLVSMVQA